MGDMVMKKAGLGFGILMGSYLIAGLINASPVTQSPLPASSSRVRVIVIAPESGLEQAPVDVETSPDLPRVSDDPFQSI